MALSSFSFGSLHSWSDHTPVERAVKEINTLPLYAGGNVRLGSSFTIQTIENSLAGMKRFEESSKKRLEEGRCNGYNAETLGAQQKVIDDIKSYVSGLEQIRDYMNNYSRCGC